MGKGANMAVLNLDSATHTSTLSNVQCISDGTDNSGSNPNAFNNAQYPPMGSVTAYIEATCMLETSKFQINFDQGGENGGYAGFTIQSSLAAPPVNVVADVGPIKVYTNGSGEWKPYSGQGGIGILRKNSKPLSQAPFTNIGGKTWMQQAIEANPDFLGRQLNMVSLPASHDAGMSMTQDCTSLAGARVTQTQQYNIAAQLGFGVRYFDLRPAVHSIYPPVSPGGLPPVNWKPTLYTGHFSDKFGGQGCLGEELSDILDAVAAFMNNTSDEIVILKFSHYSDRDARSFPSDIQQQMIGLIQGTLQDFMLTATLGEKVGLMTVGQIINGKKRVICVFDSLDESLYSPANGILRFGGLDLSKPVPTFAAPDTNLDVYDKFSDTENSVSMMVDQLARYRMFSQAGLTNGELFLLSYTVTLEGADNAPGGSPSVLGMAKGANEYLWQYATGMYPGPLPKGPVLPPNLVYVDAVDQATPMLAAAYFNSKVPGPLQLGTVAIRSSVFRSLALRCDGGMQNADCQWGIGPWERFRLIPTGTQGQFYVQSVQWGLYLTLDPQGNTSYNPAGVGDAPWSQTPMALSIQSAGKGRYTIAMASSPNVYLRMDGTNVTSVDWAGEGIVNCQIGTPDEWEKMYIVAA